MPRHIEDENQPEPYVTETHNHMPCMERGLAEFRYLKLDLSVLKDEYLGNMEAGRTRSPETVRRLMTHILARLSEIASLQRLDDLAFALRNASATTSNPQFLSVLKTLEQKMSEPMDVSQVPRDLDALKRAPGSALVAVGEMLGHLKEQLEVVQFTTLTHDEQAAKIHAWLAEHDAKAAAN